MDVAAFDFALPPDRIAQQPVRPKDHARLLWLPAEGAVRDRHVYDLPDILRADDVLVFNDTRVIPARLYGHRDAVAVEALLHQEQAAPAPGTSRWAAFVKPAKRLKAGQTVAFGPGLSAQVAGRTADGAVVFDFPLDRAGLLAALAAHGHVPLPPYIRGGRDAPQDREDYQSPFAARDGAVAAPTASLHFTPDLLSRLRALGVEVVTLTLHVGAGTFQPVKATDTDDHVMHAEYAELSPDAAAALNRARGAGRRIVAVGTTAVRTLESAADDRGQLAPFTGETRLFITPGYRFRAIDALITNFHLPKSTLFMLVSAVSGLDRMQAAYAHAIARGYRFYSYGDACLLEL